MKLINVHGIQFRLLVSTSVLVILMSAIATWVIYAKLSDYRLGLEQQKLEQAAELSATVFAMKAESARRVAHILANSAEVQGLVRARLNGGIDPLGDLTEADWKSRLSREFGVVLDKNPEYSQISFIGVRNNGRELLRVRREGADAVAVDDSQLESRIGEDVLIEGQTLAQGETRIVNWDPADRGGESKAIVHVISGVFTPSGRVLGVIAMDIDLAVILARSKVNDPERSTTYIVGKTGGILLQSETTQDLSKIDRQPQEIREVFPQYQLSTLSGPEQSLFYTLADGQNRRRALAIRRLALNPDQPGESISIVHSIPYADFVATVSPYARQLVIAAIIFVILILVLVALFSHYLVRPLDRMTRSIEVYGDGKALSDLPVRQKDQIGVLARAFTQLIDSLDARQATLASEAAERRHAEAETRASETRYKASLDLMRDAHFISDKQGVIQSVNSAGAEMFRYPVSELVGTSVAVLLPQESRSANETDITDDCKTTLANIVGKDGDTGLFAARKDGSTFPVSILIEEFATDEGEYLAAIVRDVTHEQEIAALNDQLHTVVQCATDCIALMNNEGVIEYVNPRFEFEFGYSRDTVLGKKTTEMGWRRSEARVYDEAFATVSGGGVWSGQITSETSDGSTIEHDVTVSPVFDAKGRVVNQVYIARNTGERNQLERDLAQAQKLESIGRLAAGIAHEINTPTQYVGDNTRFIKDAFKDVGVLFATLYELKDSANGLVSAEALNAAMEEADVEYLREEVPLALDQSIEGVERVAKIVRAMKEFSHPAPDKTPIDLNGAIESTVTVASNEWKYVADVRTDFDPELPLVSCLPGEFNQVILNMIVNAAHAIGDKLGSESSEKGVITVSTRCLAHFAEIRICDTGAGMSDEVRKRVFDPFFTTKEVGKGTGQGLNIAHSVIVEKHGGKIEVESEPGEGSCFIIHLPLEEPVSANDTVAA